jgi:hypothetical protein
MMLFSWQKYVSNQCVIIAVPMHRKLGPYSRAQNDVSTAIMS